MIVNPNKKIKCNHALFLLRLSNIYLSILGKPGTCEKYGKFQCNNGKCIGKFRICNLNNDCGDNSDESKTDPAFCGRCASFLFDFHQNIKVAVNKV